MTPSCMQPKLSLYSNNISYVSILVCYYQKRLRVSVHTAPVATLPIPGLCFQRSSMLLYVLFVSIKSLPVNIMLLEYSFSKLKYDSTTLPMSGFLGSSPTSASPVSLAILNFFIKSYPHSPDKNSHRRPRRLHTGY